MKRMTGIAAAAVVASSLFASTTAPVAAADPLSLPAAKQPRLRPFVDLRANFEPSRGRIGGSVLWVIPNVSNQPLNEARFWLYPNRLASRPVALGDINFHWLYPNGFSAATIRIEAARVGSIAASAHVESSAAGPDTVLRVELPAPVPAGGEITVELDFSTTLPARLGGFGCTGSPWRLEVGSDWRECRMMGGFYPFPVHLGITGFESDAAPDRIDFVARVTAPSGTDLLLGDRYFNSRGAPLLSAASNAPYVTLVAARSLHGEEVAAGGMRAQFFHKRVRPPNSNDEVLPYVREDRAGLVLDVVTRALDFVGSIGIDPRFKDPQRPVVLSEAPLRHELVQVHGNLILVSDRLFGIFPVDRLRKFHRLELFRAVVNAVLNRTTREIEPDPDVDLSTEVVSIHLTDVFTLREFRRREFARDLLRPFAFIPAVDQLMYAPSFAASSSYFGDPDDRDLIRDDVRRFAHRRGGGRLIYAKLLDLLQTAGMQRLSQSVLGEGIPLRQAAARAFGRPLDWFWRQWLTGSPPRVNYRLGRIRSTATTTTTGGSGVHVTIEVQRQGADLTEPVEVRVIDGAGVEHHLVWAGRGPSHLFQIDLPAGLASVEIDPRHRLIESAVGSLDAADDPLTDNRDPMRWRLIYSGAAALVDVTALNLSFAAAVRLKPQHDLRNSIMFLAHHSPSTRIGVESAYTRLFGRQADRNRLASSFGLSLSGSLLDPNFGVAANETLRPQWRLSGSLFTEHDDRAFFVDPWRAVGMIAGVGYALTGLESGERLSQLNASIELLRLVELLPGHVLAFDVQGGATFGDIRVRSQLAQIGGPTGLRGYAVGELFGRGRAVGRLEMRNRYVSDLDWNVAHFTSVRGFGGNLFLEAGLISSCDDLSVGRNDVFYDVGYSLRVLHDAFGVYQQLLSIDLAIPLNRHDRVCMGQHSQGPPGDPQMRITRPPFVVLISFLPTF